MLLLGHGQTAGHGKTLSRRVRPKLRLHYIDRVRKMSDSSRFRIYLRDHGRQRLVSELMAARLAVKSAKAILRRLSCEPGASGGTAVM
jgi:hypothetical protein